MKNNASQRFCHLTRRCRMRDTHRVGLTRKVAERGGQCDDAGEDANNWLAHTEHQTWMSVVVCVGGVYQLQLTEAQSIISFGLFRAVGVVVRGSGVRDRSESGITTKRRGAEDVADLGHCRLQIQCSKASCCCRCD